MQYFALQSKFSPICPTCTHSAFLEQVFQKWCTQKDEVGIFVDTLLREIPK